METELKSGRLIGYFFAIPCSVVALICLYQSSAHSGFWLLSILFGLGAAIGIHLLVHPRLLVSVKHDMLGLYPGSLFRNRRQVELPLEEIEGFEVRSVSDGDGTSWLLTLHMRVPQRVSEDAQRWINATVPKSFRDQASATTIHWILSWPEGGVAGARSTMRQLTQCA